MTVYITTKLNPGADTSDGYLKTLLTLHQAGLTNIYYQKINSQLIIYIEHNSFDLQHMALIDGDVEAAIAQFQQDYFSQTNYTITKVERFAFLPRQGADSLAELLLSMIHAPLLMFQNTDSVFPQIIKRTINLKNEVLQAASIYKDISSRHYDFDQDGYIDTFSLETSLHEKQKAYESILMDIYIKTMNYLRMPEQGRSATANAHFSINPICERNLLVESEVEDLDSKGISFKLKLLSKVGLEQIDPLTKRFTSEIRAQMDKGLNFTIKYFYNVFSEVAGIECTITNLTIPNNMRENFLLCMGRILYATTLDLHFTVRGVEIKNYISPEEKLAKKESKLTECSNAFFQARDHEPRKWKTHRDDENVRYMFFKDSKTVNLLKEKLTENDLHAYKGVNSSGKAAVSVNLSK